MLALLLGFALPGCQTPPPEPPDTTDLLPTSFSATGEAWLAVQWWEHLDDPALNRLIEQALADSPSLAATWDRLDQARAIARREGADLRPTLDAEAGASAGRRRTTSGNNAGETGTQLLSIGLVASYEVDLWGRIRSQVEAARLDAQASVMDVHASAITLSANVATTWYQFVEARGQIDLIASQIDINQQVLELLELRFRLGQSALADVLRQRQLLESRRGDLVLAQRDADVLVHQLNVLLGRPVDTPVPNDQVGLISPPALPTTGLPLDLIQRRPDVVQAMLSAYAQDQRLAAALAERYPQLTLSANATFDSEKLRDLLDNWLATIAAELVQPLIDGGQRRAEIDRAAASVSEQINLYRSTILTATQDVEDALVRESAQERFVQSLGQQLELSEQVLERTRDGYLNRGLDYLDVLQALDNNQSLAQDLLTARRQQIEQRIALCRALAGPPRLTRPEPRTLRADDQAAEQDAEPSAEPGPETSSALPPSMTPPTDQTRDDE